MNDSELERRIRATRAPERPEEYWEDFPQRVMSRAATRRNEAPQREPWLAAAAWGTGLALACVMLGFGIGQSDRQAVCRLVRDGQNLSRKLDAAPNALGAIMQSERRMRFVIADTP